MIPSIIDDLTDLGDGLQRPVILLGDVDSLHLLVHPGPLSGVTLKRLLLLFLLKVLVWTMSDNDYVLLDQLIILRNNSIVDIADLHDGEHDDVEGGVGAVEHLPLHAAAEGPHLLVDVLKHKKYGDYFPR